MAENRFDTEAAAWENNPAVTESSKLAFEAITSHAKLSQEVDVLEIGCGTGYLSAMIAPNVKRLLGVDTSAGMIQVFDAKRAQHSNMTGKVLLLERPEQIPQNTNGEFDSFQLVISHLVFHHIPDMLPTVQVAHDCLSSGGQLIITDFERTPTSRAFHPENKMEGVERHGLSKEEMHNLLTKAGCVNVTVKEAFVLRKTTENDGEQDFPFLICIGYKA